MVGFPAKSGVLALAVTSHPDFDDTPLFDENRDGNFDNDGGLTPFGLPEDLPLYIDSPGYSPRIDGKVVEVRVPFAKAQSLKGVAFDAVTAGLRISKNLHAPLFCVAAVYDVASGKLTLPGRVR